VAFTNPDALAIAKKCDEDRAEGKQLGCVCMHLAR
jgi:hypothetical protein